MVRHRLWNFFVLLLLKFPFLGYDDKSERMFMLKILVVFPVEGPPLKIFLAFPLCFQVCNSRWHMMSTGYIGRGGAICCISWFSPKEASFMLLKTGGEKAPWAFGSLIMSPSEMVIKL